MAWRDEGKYTPFICCSLPVIGSQLGKGEKFLDENKFYIYSKIPIFTLYKF